ncbi:MAG: hypothetical protein IJL92_06920 [Thermoguttaceae bacterium]|nr:hypothetical protein [Thermoguttaceae bacterium]
MKFFSFAFVVDARHSKIQDKRPIIAEIGIAKNNRIKMGSKRPATDGFMIPRREKKNTKRMGPQKLISPVMANSLSRMGTNSCFSFARASSGAASSDVCPSRAGSSLGSVIGHSS